MEEKLTDGARHRLTSISRKYEMDNHVPKVDSYLYTYSITLQLEYCFEQPMDGKTCFPTALQQLNGMHRKNAFPSHGSLPLQSPYLPPRVRDFILKKQEARPLVHLGRLLDGGGKLEGYRSLGMFNIKKAIRMLQELWELDRKRGE